MTDPKNISIKDYTYFLPEERIAKYPIAERDASKLLIYRNGEITVDIYKNISQHIPSNSLLVFNNTRVVEARLLFQKSSGGVVEIFCLSPHEQYADISTAMLRKEKVLWHCLVGGASKWKAGQILEKKIQLSGSVFTLHAKYVEKKADSFIIELSWLPPELSFAEALHLAGAIPLPPYIKRAPEDSDAERYQTVYARFDGSVAAPTAGLHFTDHIFNSLKEKNIKTDFVTLHVGAGTFKPVKSETMKEHDMHAEWIDVSRETIENILLNLSNKIVAVGTTSLRTIESLYWIGRSPEPRSGRKAKPRFANITEPGSVFQLGQWAPYQSTGKDVPVQDALQNLLQWMDKNKLERLTAKTQILIAPGYPFKIVDGLITNFHQPQSTLLLLVAALIGDDLPAGRAGWKKVYQYALENGFRFLSYGDGNLLWRKDN